MSSELQTRMRDLADAAPTDLPRSDLWAVGVRRRRRRQVGAVLGTAVVVALVGAAGTLVRPPAAEPQPAVVPAKELHLPRTVNPPSPWTEGTDELGPPGPLAVLAGGKRKVRDGLTGSRDYQSFYGISAVDGSARFLDLPVEGLPGAVDSAGQAVLSPDGHKVAYVRSSTDAEGTHRVVHGWAVYDTVTGKTVVLKDPEAATIRGGEAFEMEFTGDSRYLVTDYARTAPATNRTDELVAWDVSSGALHPVEPPGKYWLPNLGSGPSGVVWSRGTRTHVVDPVSASGTFDDVPQQVVQATYAPIGEAFAYIGHEKVRPDRPATWLLYAGTSPGAASGRQLDLDIGPGRLLGWRDAEHVVLVDDFGVTVRIVDVRTGEAHGFELSLPDETFPAPIYASDLWGNDLVDGVRADRVPDPRWDVWLPAALVLGGLLLVGGTLWGRRRRVRA